MLRKDLCLETMAPIDIIISTSDEPRMWQVRGGADALGDTLKGRQKL